ncbi:MAG: hydrogenase formation protein HypD [Candidatus Omnitrophota bacterium]
MLKFVDEYRDKNLCFDIASKIKDISKTPFNIMEVCGGHTMSIRKNGIHKLVGENINFMSGPGCPVCVTAIRDIDKAIALADLNDVVVCTFGDLFYVPGSSSSLSKKRADGVDIRIVYSVYDVIEFARKEKDKKFIFISIGFETTVPTTAAAIIQAKNESVDNFYVFALNKTMPTALRAVISSPDSKIDALMCPGHVSTITGIDMYRFIVDEFNISCCIAGFEPADILKAVLELTKLYEGKNAKLINAYERAVLTEGNIKAKNIIDEVFEPCDANWRGVGDIPSSGLKVKASYKEFDAEESFQIDVKEQKEISGCICGEILIGAKKPVDCSLFGKGCTPENPIGACMVSSEGACAAWYKYGM